MEGEWVASEGGAAANERVPNQPVSLLCLSQGCPGAQGQGQDEDKAQFDPSVCSHSDNPLYLAFGRSMVIGDSQGVYPRTLLVL